MRPEDGDELCGCMIVLKWGSLSVLEYNNGSHNGRTHISNTISTHLLRYTMLQDGFREQQVVHAFRATKAATFCEWFTKEYSDCAMSVDDIRKPVNIIRNKGKQSIASRLVPEFEKVMHVG